MITVTVDSNKTSTYDAIIWAQRHFGHGFKVKHQFPGWNWLFEFEQPEQASLFALKWVK